MYRVIVTVDFKDGSKAVLHKDYTKINYALTFIMEDMLREKDEDLFYKYEIFKLRKDVKTP